MLDLSTNVDKARLGSRRAERLPLAIVVDARNGHSRLQADVVDISSSGVRLRTLSPLRVGHSFWVKLPTIEAKQIRVAWVDGFVSGCAFTQPLAPCVVKTVIEAVARPDAALTYLDRRAIRRV